MNPQDKVKGELESRTADTPKERTPHGTASDAYLPVQYYVDFLDLLNRRRDAVEIITYRDLPWGGDYDFLGSYPEERRNWKNQIAAGERSKHKIYVLLQHDVDGRPERTVRLLQEEERLGIRSNVMIFNRLINRTRLAKTGTLQFDEYCLDDDYLCRLQRSGFVVGYHCNAYEQALFNLTKAEQIFVEDVRELRDRFNIEFFSAHGGVRDSAGKSNSCVRVPKGLLRSIRWVHNTHGPVFDGTYSDGAFASGKKRPEDLDLRGFVRAWLPGGRYRILVHPQYYHPRPSRLPLFETVPWYRDVWSAYCGGIEGDTALSEGQMSRSQPSIWSGILDTRRA
jgi:hypothetical protein